MQAAVFDMDEIERRVPVPSTCQCDVPWASHRGAHGWVVCGHCRGIVNRLLQVIDFPHTSTITPPISSFD